MNRGIIHGIIPPEEVVMKVVEEMYMTDEQFATYNKLIELVEVLIEKLPDHEKEEFRQKKNDILLKK